MSRCERVVLQQGGLEDVIEYVVSELDEQDARILHIPSSPDPRLWFLRLRDVLSRRGGSRTSRSRAPQTGLQDTRSRAFC